MASPDTAPGGALANTGSSVSPALGWAIIIIAFGLALLWMGAKL